MPSIEESKTKDKLPASFFVGLNTQRDLFCHYSLTRKAVEPNASSTSDTGYALTKISYSKMKKIVKFWLTGRSMQVLKSNRGQFKDPTHLHLHMQTLAGSEDRPCSSQPSQEGCEGQYSHPEERRAPQGPDVIGVCSPEKRWFPPIIAVKSVRNLHYLPG